MPTEPIAAAIDEERGAREAERLETPRFAPPAGWCRRLVTAVAVAFSGFQLYTAVFGTLEPLVQRPIHLAFAVALIALTYRLHWPGQDSSRVGLLDWLFLLVGVWSVLHVVIEGARLRDRIFFVDPLTPMDMAAATTLVLVTLEICRRTVGGGLSLVTIGFLAYALLGHWMPGSSAHPSMSISDLLETVYLSNESIFGIPLGVSATYVFVFILFGAFIMRLGLMGLFVDLAMAAAGATAGGPAKVAIFCSALFGTISGSGIANAITCGSFTIPLMKRVGYRPQFAAGVEAAASMGGNIMPPIMGAAAFIMADLLGVAYVEVAIAAIIPAIFYFLGIGTMVHMEALKTGLARLPKDGLPRAGQVLLRRGHLLLPVVGLVYMLMTGWNVMTAGVVGIALTVAVSLLRPDTRMTPGRLIEILEWSAMTALPVVAACAVVGIVIGVIAQTGVGVKLASAILGLAGGSMLLTLVFAMLASLLLGLGLPTTPTYIITAALTAPALVQFGIPAIAAHMFVFYFGILADITPPTAIAPYAVAGIAGADPNKTCYTACMLAASGFIVPFVFAHDPVMLDPLLHKPGSTLVDLVLVIAETGLGIVLLSGAFIGWLRINATVVERCLMFAGGACLMAPSPPAAFAGLALGIAVWLLQTVRLARIRG